MADGEPATAGAVREPLCVDAMHAMAPELFALRAQDGPAATTLRERSRRVEADEVRAAIAACDGDRDAACKLLGISKTTMWRKLNAG